MTKKPSLSVALQQASGKPEKATVTVEQRPSPPGVPPSRQGKKTIAGHFDPAVSRQLKEIVVAEDTSIQELLREALNDLFRKRGRSPIA